MAKHVTAGGVHFTFHDLRSVSADGADTDEEARDRLGHTAVATIKRFYRRGSQKGEAAVLDIQHFWIYSTAKRRKWCARRDCCGGLRPPWPPLRYGPPPRRARRRPTWPQTAGQVVKLGLFSVGSSN